jgi:hypothetical protein
MRSSRQAYVANETVDQISNLDSIFVVPHGLSGEPADSVFAVLKADALPGIVETMVPQGLQVNENMMTAEEESTDDECKNECEYLHDCMHETPFHSSMHNAEETEAHGIGLAKLVNTMVPVDDGTPLPPVEAQVDPDALQVGTCGNSSCILCLSIHLLSGEVVSELRIRDSDLLTILDLKRTIGHKTGFDPLMIELPQQGTEEVLHNKHIVARLPSWSSLQSSVRQKHTFESSCYFKVIV